MTLERLNLAAVRPEAWANGRGTTRELLRRESPDGRLLLRLSVADVVEPGPFSRLPGIDRVLVPIAGPGFTLSIDGRIVVLGPFEPIAFAGEAAVSVTAIAAPSLDFNVMTARHLGPVQVAVQRSSFLVPAGGDSAVYVVAGAFHLPGETTPLGAGDCVALGRLSDAAIHWQGEGLAIVVSFP